jgi:hypothetical protein
MSSDDDDQTSSEDTGKEDTGSEDADGEDTGNKMSELSDEGKENVQKMAAAYEDRETVVLPGTDGTITGTAVNEWLDDEGNPKFGKEKQQEREQEQEKEPEKKEPETKEPEKDDADST